MARPKAPKSDDKVKPSETMKMPSVKAVQEMAGELRAARQEHGEVSEGLREAMAEAKKSKRIHPGAIKLVEGWVDKAKKTDRGLTAGATMIAHLDYYRDVLGLDDLIKQQGQMFKRPEAGEIDDGEAEVPVAEEDRDLRPRSLRTSDDPGDGKPGKLN